VSARPSVGTGSTGAPAWSARPSARWSCCSSGTDWWSTTLWAIQARPARPPGRRAGR